MSSPPSADSFAKINIKRSNGQLQVAILPTSALEEALSGRFNFVTVHFTHDGTPLPEVITAKNFPKSSKPVSAADIRAWNPEIRARNSEK
jgi:hypothetical protein